MGLESKRVSLSIGILLVELTLILQASFGFFFLSVDSFLVGQSLFHVHGISPVGFTFED